MPTEGVTVGLIKRRIVALAAIMTCTAGSLAAPLFPDVPDSHWARDAVAALAAKGLVEGYPDGTFKGDRSASRWELAMLVSRLLVKMENEHSIFATRAELEEARKLALALREELESLGVRVDSLEQSIGNLDRRVTELERISFYGSLETRVSFHSFYNSGNHFSDPTDALLNYDELVGTAIGSGSTISGGPAAGIRFNPYSFGAFTVNNLDKGTPLINGTGFTNLATLGLNIQVSEDVDARAEFKAFSSQGNALTDLYYGVSAPYFANGFTGTDVVGGGLSGVQPRNNTPFTRMALDHFWVHHKPSNIRLRLGAISDLKFDELVYQKQFNPAAFSPAFLDSYGFQLTGQHDSGEGQNFSWELLGTLLPDRNSGVGGNAYANQAWGGNLAYNFSKDHGQVKFNFLRATNDASGGAARQVGLISEANLVSITPWVNPGAFFFGALGGPNLETAGLGSTGDVRPVPMPAFNNDGIIGIPGAPNYGNLGPQAQDMYGVSARYRWGGSLQPYLRGEYARSDYRPSQNSGYSVTGDAFRISAGVVFFEDTLSLDAEYLSVDPTYDPFILQIPRPGEILFNGFRFGENFFHQRGDLYNLHDTSVFPHNREGFRGKLKWDFSPQGSLGIKAGFLNQKDPSIQDIRFSTGSLGTAIPNSDVLGFSPGFTDPVFGGYSPFTFVPSGGNALATPLESPRGRVRSLALDGRYRFVLAESAPDSEDFWSRGLTLSIGFNSTNFHRKSSLTSLVPGPNGIAGENVNHVDLTYIGWGVNLDYEVTPDFILTAGYNEFSIRGHYDPYGIYSSFAVSASNTDFHNLNLTQSQPTVGFNYAVSESVSWHLATVFLSTKDRVSGSVFSVPIDPGTNRVFIPQRSVHPFSYDGIMVNSSLKITF